MQFPVHHAKMDDFKLVKTVFYFDTVIILHPLVFENCAVLEHIHKLYTLQETYAADFETEFCLNRVKYIYIYILAW